MTQHGGSLSVYSPGEGCGSTFTVMIPTLKHTLIIASRNNHGSRFDNDNGTSNNNSIGNNIGDGNNNGIILRHSLSSLEPIYVDKSACYYPKISPNSRRLRHSSIACEFDTTPEVLLVVSNLNILVVDDSTINRKMLCRILDNLSHNCEEAVDGRDAVEHLKRQQNNNSMGNDDNNSNNIATTSSGVYDAIIIDYSMPNMTGPEAVKEIRNMGYKSLIIGATGHADARETKIFIDSGADTVLVKPIATALLKSILSSPQRYLTETSLRSHAID
eukprot:gene13965-29727_t